MSERILDCDICGSPMDHFKQGIEDIFKCTKCEQSWGFSDTVIHRLILKRMYPQKMSPEMRHEFIDYQVSEFFFIQLAKLISGRITAEEYDKTRKDILAEAERAHLAVPKKESWFIKLFNRNKKSEGKK